MDPVVQQLLIGGRWQDAEGGRTVDKIGSYVGEPVSRVAAASPGDAGAAVQAAAAAFPDWAAAPPAQRREVLLHAADLLQQRAGEIAAICTAETGATFGWGMFNVMLAAGMMREAGAQAYGLLGEVIPSDTPGLLAMGIRQPVGVVVGIAPWNAPVILATRAIAMPLAYGNTVVLKASEESPRTHGAIVRALVDAGIPNGVVNLLTNDPAQAPEVVEALIAHPQVTRVNFTGSTRVGRVIAATAAAHLKRTVLELGGKASQVVLADADLDEAAAAANFGAYMNSGQICMSTERLVVDRAVSRELADKIAARAAKLIVGDPADQATMIGAMISEAAVRKLTELVADAVAQGAEVLCGGAAEGRCFQPTVLFGVTPAMRVYGEESFGPLLAVIEVDGVDEAVKVANDTEYGLSAAVFSRDVTAALAVARQLRTGICHVNSATVQDEAQMPFGGVKASGWGRFGARAALEEFTELRWLTIQETPRHYPI
jgi:acyl-CoA reductase-like NAD-dependent aldehyde dehydrogenase